MSCCFWILLTYPWSPGYTLPCFCFSLFIAFFIVMAHGYPGIRYPISLVVRNMDGIKPPAIILTCQDPQTPWFRREITHICMEWGCLVCWGIGIFPVFHRPFAYRSSGPKSFGGGVAVFIVVTLIHSTMIAAKMGFEITRSCQWAWVSMTASVIMVSNLEHDEKLFR